MHVQRTEAAIASQQPNSEAQRYMIKLCSEINNATEGCTEYYHRNHYELVKTESTSKQTDKGRVRGVKFTVAYHVPILQKITRVLGVLSTPIPLKKEKEEYFYMSFEVPDVIGYSEESKKAFSMDKCEVVPHLKTRFCKMGLLTRKSSEMDCSTAILENVPHRYCESSVYSSPSDCLYTGSTTSAHVLISHFNEFEIVEHTKSNFPGVTLVKSSKNEMLNITMIERPDAAADIICTTSRFWVAAKAMNAKPLSTMIKTTRLDQSLILREMDETNFWRWRSNNVSGGYIRENVAKKMIENYASQLTEDYKKAKGYFDKPSTKQNWILWSSVTLIIIIIMIVMCLVKPALGTAFWDLASGIANNCMNCKNWFRKEKQPAKPWEAPIKYRKRKNRVFGIPLKGQDTEEEFTDLNPSSSSLSSGKHRPSRKPDRPSAPKLKIDCRQHKSLSENDKRESSGSDVDVGRRDDYYRRSVWRP